MAILSSLLSKRPVNVAVTSEKAWNPALWNLIGSQSNSGVNVNEETALNYSAVFNAVTLYSGTISTLPLRLLIEKSNKKTPAVDKSIYHVMHTRWNKYMTAQVGREVLTAHVLTWGNGYAEKIFDKLGNIVELWPIPPNKIRPEMVDGELVYIIQVEGQQIILPREKVLHIPGLGFDGFVGYSVIGLARESIGLGMAMEQFGSHFFGNGTHPGVVVEHPNKLSEAAHKNLKDSLVSKYSGLGNAHKLLLLEEGMKLHAVGIPPEDAQFLESRQFQIPEIARWFNLPPHKLKDMTKSSFNNIESEQVSFVTDSILPWIVRFETNFNMQLLADRDSKKGYYFKHVVEGLLRGDTKARAEFYTKMFQIGSMSPDEIREKEDLDPIADGSGKRYFVPLNYVPLDKIDEEKPDDNQSAQTTEQSKKSQEGREQNKRGNLIPL